jgi:hypothetical protein
MPAANKIKSQVIENKKKTYAASLPPAVDP